MSEVLVRCPICKDKSVLAMTPVGNGKYHCMMCGYDLELEVKVPVEKSKKSPITIKQMKDAFAKAGSVVNSQLERNIDIKAKLTGDWAKAFTAAEVLMVEGIGMKKDQVLVQVLKRGINAVIEVFASSALQREMLTKAVEEGSLRQETVDNLLADFDNLTVKLKDKDFTIGGEE